MTKKNGIILACCIIAVSGLFGINQAKAGGYAGISANYIDTEITNHFGTTIKGGYSFNDFLAIEGRYLVNSSDEGYNGVNIEIDSLYGVYLIGSIPVTNSLSAYVLFGHSEGEVKATYRGYSESVDDGSSSLGFGVQYDIVENWTINAEYTELFDDIDQASVGLRLNF